MGSLFTIYKHLGDIVKCISMILLQIQQENNFLPTSKHRQAELHHFLGICLYNRFIYRSNFIFPKISQNEMPSSSGFSRKTVNSQGDSMVPNQNTWKLLFTDLVNTNTI